MIKFRQISSFISRIFLFFICCLLKILFISDFDYFSSEQSWQVWSCSNVYPEQWTLGPGTGEMVAVESSVCPLSSPGLSQYHQRLRSVLSSHHSHSITGSHSWLWHSSLHWSSSSSSCCVLWSEKNIWTNIYTRVIRIEESQVSSLVSSDVMLSREQLWSVSLKYYADTTGSTGCFISSCNLMPVTGTLNKTFQNSVSHWQPNVPPIVETYFFYFLFPPLPSLSWNSMPASQEWKHFF